MTFGVHHWVILGTALFLSQGQAIANPGHQHQSSALTIAQAEPAASPVVVETETVETGEMIMPILADVDRLKAIERYNAGVDKLTAGDFAGAIAEFTAALGFDPGDADTFYNRGYSYHVLGQYEAALNDYGSAIELNPEFADAYGNRCYAAYLLKNYEQALADCEAAIALKDDNPDFLINRGNAYDDLAVIASADADQELAQEYHEKAIADYDAAIELRPDHAKAYYNRALAHNRLGNNTAAIADYTASIERNSQFAEAYFNRGITHYKLDQTEQAIADFQQAAQIFAEKNQIENQAQALEILDSLQP
ncbi:MAG: tetratricopeptide repeat protein [Limnothrix sp. RL_2_0]|nr:tetratricopeptide repeat protein [Limnothrix sp. RL_2_0]